MKKILLFFLLFAFSATTFAQKGKSEVGINLGVAPTFSTDPVSANFGIGAKYRYGISNKFRIEGGFTYYLKSAAEISMYDVSINLQYLLKFKDKLTFYPLAGLGLIGVSPSDDYEPSGNHYQDAYHDYQNIKDGKKSTNIVLNLGAGLQYDITDHLNANVELKYPVAITDVNPLPISIGVAYKF